MFQSRSDFISSGAGFVRITKLLGSELRQRTKHAKDLFFNETLNKFFTSPPAKFGSHFCVVKEDISKFATSK